MTRIIFERVTIPIIAKNKIEIICGDHKYFIRHILGIVPLFLKLDVIILTTFCYVDVG